MKKGSVLVELRPDRSLLDPSFEGYKLSLDSIPIYRQTIQSGVHVIQPSDDQYSFYHVKTFSLHNHLYINPYNPNNVYFVDGNLKVFKVILSPSKLISLKEVYQINESNSSQKVRYNISIVFASSEIIVISDGVGTIHLAKTNGQDDTEAWEICNSSCLFTEEVSCVLSDAKVVTTDGKRILHVMLLHVEEKTAEEKDNNTGLFHTILKWRMFIQNEDNSWNKSFYKKLSIDGSVDYVALEPNCKSIYVISDKQPKWVYDSENPVETESKIDAVTTKVLYSWRQTEEDIAFWFPFPEGTEKADFEIMTNDKQLEIKVKGESIVFGEFFHKVEKDLTSWSFDKNELEIQLTKLQKGLPWKYLIPDGKGKEIIEVNDIPDKSEFQEEGINPSFNTQQLEDCDTVSCDTTSLVRINCEDHLITHEVSLSSSQWLFKVYCDPCQTPAMCIRHDVDACVWQFSEVKDNEKTWPYEHIGTFSAFGYVQASKTQKKFLTSPSNLSYVAVCEASHHIYIYRQPSPLTSELKNRATGKKVNLISKQQLVNLETNEQVLGIHATSNILHVLLEKTICVLVINS